MTLTIDSESAESIFVDRSGVVRHAHGREGFHIGIGGLSIDFEDERDAERVACLILNRLGVAVVPEVTRG